MASDKIHKVKIEVINSISELERLNYKYQPSGAEEIKLLCPVHELGSESSTPSCSLNIKKNVWKCFASSCNAKGDIVGLLAYIKGETRDLVIKDLSTRYDLAAKKSLNPELVEEYHANIWSAGPLLEALRVRGINDDLVRKARLGFHEGRITIPIYDLERNVIEIRRYLPGAPGPEKMRNTPGYGGNHIYMPEQLKYPTIWICGGEMKALLAASLLNPFNIGCISTTSGEGNWETSFSERIKEKNVFICQDIDKAGLRGAKKIAQFVFTYAASTKIIELPLDKTKYPKGDINDYVASEKATAEDLMRCMEEAKKFYPEEVKEELPSDPIKLALSEAVSADNVGKYAELEGIITSLDPTPYLIPKTVNVECGKDQQNCSQCPVYAKNPNEEGMVELEIKATNSYLLEMIGTPKFRQPEIVHNALRLPPCKTCKLHQKQFYNIMDVRITPQLNIGHESSKNTVQPAFAIGCGFEMNTPYIFKGKVFPHPKNQQAILLLNQVDAGKDNLTSYKLTPKDYEAMKLFQPSEWTTQELVKKLSDIYNDLSTNVTKIFDREEMHLVYDLAYHSPLVFEFDSKEESGWINALVCGDTAQGKTETIKCMMKHYGLGEITDTKNASRAGIIGGLTQDHFVQWGVIPIHDKRLVCMEEISGIPDIVKSMTSMRSTGIAEIPKIEKRRAYARTRIIFNSNPPNNRKVSGYNYAVEIIKELFGAPEDVRRLDIALIVKASQVSAAQMNILSKDRPKYEHKYTADLCQKVVLWSWTRLKDQVKFDQDAVDCILENATKLSSKFSEDIPLMAAGSMRAKLARLSASIAARTFSFNCTPDTILVRKCHVEFISMFLDKIYSDPVFGFLDFTEAQSKVSKIEDPEAVKKGILGTRHPKDLINQLLRTDEITRNDFEDWCECDRDTAQKLVSLLNRKYAIVRLRKNYIKTSDFIQFLKKLKVEFTDEKKVKGVEVHY